MNTIEHSNDSSEISQKNDITSMNQKGMAVMKFGMRKPSLKRALKARTTGKMKRAIKRTTNPLYGKKGMWLIRNAKKTAYNRIYKKSTFSIRDFFKFK